MSALPFTPLTITPRPPESRRPNSPSQREGAGGWVPSVTIAASSPDEPDALPPSRREGAGGGADLDFPAPLHFNPTDQTAAAIINDFAAQDETLRGIADKYETTLESLTLWLARPDIAQRIHALESACATRARLVVANNLAAIANKLLHLLDEAKLDHESIHRVPASTHHAFAARMQSRESARKTANLLLRIARYTPLPPLPPHPTHPTHPNTPPPPRASSPRERGEDRLATGQAGEGNDAHLNAHAVQYTAAAPTTNPTRQRGATDAPTAPATAAQQQHSNGTPLDALQTPDHPDPQSIRRSPPPMLDARESRASSRCTITVPSRHATAYNSPASPGPQHASAAAAPLGPATHPP